MAPEALANVLYIDLTTKTSETRSRPELFDPGLGGAHAAIKLLEEECPEGGAGTATANRGQTASSARNDGQNRVSPNGPPPSQKPREGIDPLSPENPIIFAVGPLTGLFPLASKTVAMFKSPLTGDLGESHAGGRSAVAIRHAGYGAIVIRGASDLPIYVVVDGSKVYFRDASAIWGMTACGREAGPVCLGDHGNLPSLRPAGPGRGVREQEAEGDSDRGADVDSRGRPEAVQGRL